MRHVEDVVKFLEDNGFSVVVLEPGQSYRNGGAVMYWKPEEIKAPNRIEIIQVGEKRIQLPLRIKSYENRGVCKDGRRVLDLIRLFPDANGEYEVRNAEFDIAGDEERYLSVTGISFRREKGIVYVPRKKNYKDLLD